MEFFVNIDGKLKMTKEKIDKPLLAIMTVQQLHDCKEQIPYYKCRMWVKTGWTGWAQINQGHLFSVDDEAGKLAYDLYYIKHRNVLWEISILVKAVFMALGGRHD